MRQEESSRPVKAKNLVLRCYAEQEQDGSWFSMCLDLNLYARGDSYEHARNKLHNVIGSYLKDALTIDREYIGDLVMRRAPLYFWLRYFVILCLVRLRKVAGARKFNEALPVIPAV
jgi:predicted RNase H-like HicB family nuclease